MYSNWTEYRIWHDRDKYVLEKRAILKFKRVNGIDGRTKNNTQHSDTHIVDWKKGYIEGGQDKVSNWEIMIKGNSETNILEGVWC